MKKKLFILTFVFIFIDQLFKWLVDINMTLNQSISIISNIFNITYVRNIGAAFSILPGSRWLFVLISIIALNIIYTFFIDKKKLKKREIIIFSMLQGGIIGNMIDRVLYGYVIDFLDFNIFGYSFPIFNIADILIVISIMLLIIVGDKDGIFSTTRKR